MRIALLGMIAACVACEPAKPPPPPEAKPAPPAPAMAAPPPATPARRPNTTARDKLTVYRAELVPRHGVLSVMLGLGARGPVEYTIVLDTDAGTATSTETGGETAVAPKKRTVSPVERDRVMALANAAWAGGAVDQGQVTDYREIFVVADGDDTFALDGSAPIEKGAPGEARHAVQALFPR